MSRPVSGTRTWRAREPRPINASVTSLAAHDRWLNEHERRLNDHDDQFDVVNERVTSLRVEVAKLVAIALLVSTLLTSIATAVIVRKLTPTRTTAQVVQAR